MLKFNKNIDDTLSKIELNNIALGDIFSGEQNFNDDDILKLQSIYSDRKTSIDNIKSWLHTEGGKNNIVKNPSDWNEIINNIINDDKQILNHFENKMLGLRKEILKIQKQKSLLIYSNFD